MREKYLIGISGTSIALMTIALVWAMPVGMDQASVNDIGAIQGHVTVLAVHPDGTPYYYSQGYNDIQFDGKNQAAARLWDDAGGTGIGINCVTLGLSGDANSDAQNGVVTAAATGEQCGDTNPPAANDVTDTTAASAGQGAVTTIITEFAIAGGDDGLTITEVALSEPGGANTISRFLLADGGVGVSTGTILTITYTMTIT